MYKKSEAEALEDKIKKNGTGKGIYHLITLSCQGIKKRIEKRTTVRTEYC